MSYSRTLLGIALAGFVLLLAGWTPSRQDAAGQGQAAATLSSVHTYSVRGQIVKLPEGAPASSIQIRHEDIPHFRNRDRQVVGLRSALAQFTPAPGLYLGQLAVGEQVSFTFHVDWGDPPLMTITEIDRFLPHLADAPRYQVVRIVDGDTIVVDGGGAQETVRLIGVNTPETKDPRTEVQFYGQEASAFLSNLLKGEEVYLLTEGARTRDRYGRTLAHLYRAPDGLWVNLEIVRQGYGQVYTSEPFEAIKLFLDHQRRARESGKGLWDPVRKADWESERTAKSPPPVPSTPRRAETPTEEVKPIPQAVTVYVTRTGAKYHRGSCSYLRQSKIPIGLQDAKGRYGPCSRCNPPS